MKRTRQPSNHAAIKVTDDMLVDVKKLVKRVNSVEGPIVAWDRKRGCYGLKADRDYAKNEAVTLYEGRLYVHFYFFLVFNVLPGILHTTAVDGDYVAK